MGLFSAFAGIRDRGLVLFDDIIGSFIKQPGRVLAARVAPEGPDIGHFSDAVRIARSDLAIAVTNDAGFLRRKSDLDQSEAVEHPRIGEFGLAHGMNFRLHGFTVGAALFNYLREGVVDIRSQQFLQRLEIAFGKRFRRSAGTRHGLQPQSGADRSCGRRA